MNTAQDPKKLVESLLKRSNCRVQMAAVVKDSHGIFGWGWNSVGQGYGEHAEAAAIRRSNRDRLKGCSLYVMGRRKRNGKMVFALPCYSCQMAIMSAEIGRVYYYSGEGQWNQLIVG